MLFAFPRLPNGFSVRGDASIIDQIAALAAPLSVIGADNVREGWAGVDIGPIVEDGVPGIGHRVKNDQYFDYHHSPADTFDKIDVGELGQNVAAAAGLIWAVAELGLAQRGIRLPLTWLTEDARPAVLAAMRHAGVIET